MSRVISITIGQTSWRSVRHTCTEQIKVSTLEDVSHDLWWKCFSEIEWAVNIRIVEVVKREVRP